METPAHVDLFEKRQPRPALQRFGRWSAPKAVDISKNRRLPD